MNIMSQEQLFLKARKQFDNLIDSLLDDSRRQVRIDQVERGLFDQLLVVGLTLLKAFVADAGVGDEGKQISQNGRTLHRSDKPHQRLYRSIFGCLTIVRWVYARGAKKKIEHVPTDARLGLPRGEYSYVMEDWTERLCVKEPFAEGIEGLAEILGHAPTVQTAEDMNQRMAEYADTFRIGQPAPPVADKEQILVATADGTSVPMHRSDRTSDPDPRAGSKKGSTRRAYVGAVYSIEPFQRTADDVLDELSRKEAAARRPRPQDKRVWAEMAATVEGSMSSGCDLVFVELAIDAHKRDPDCRQTLVCLMDGEQKLWDLQSEWLGRSVEILDFFHALIRVREVAKLLQPNNKSRREEWVSEQARDLLTGNVRRVITRWRRLLREKKWSNSHRKKIESAIGYFSNNRHRMRYDEYLLKGYPIGSGVAEGTCRNLVKDRLDCTGMHWRLSGARAMLKTRALHLSGEWNEFMEYRIECEQYELYHTAA